MRNGQLQKSTLSIRVSESLRQHLEYAKRLLAGTSDESVSVSEVAKVLLESALDDRLDYRFEVARLRTEHTASLSRIRHKWELGYPLSHAEWLLLAEFVRYGCEEAGANPDIPSPNSRAQVLMAFVAVRSLRMERGVELDRYYLGNLRWQGVNDRQLDPNLVTDVVGQLLLQLKQSSAGWNREIFAALNLYRAIRDEKLSSIGGLNDVLKPHLPTLIRLAARGHWLRIRKPIRRTYGGCCSSSFSLPPLKSDSVRLDPFVNDGELEVFVTFAYKDITFGLESYPLIRDFATMLECLGVVDKWDGSAFFGCTDHGGERLTFCHRASGMMLGCAREEWDSLRNPFGEVLSRPEIEPVLSELSMEYGAI